SLHDKKFDVFRLQKLLNHRGFILAQEGAGARGFETDYFGLRTYGALVRFQNSAGLPATGFFGPETRAYINSTR
ncbi:MAG TPA: peptidoglycan-binding domain-containing protein, partial [Candidatus Paceibacterota bacterium]|nr:peptidoglycan-binding domain-containing protein [Candidatus Paceibacterota bacterium]